MPEATSRPKPGSEVNNQDTRCVLELRQLEVCINHKTVCAELDLVVRPGETWAILGMNGAGKTTLLHTIAGLRQAKSGQVLLNGTPLSGQSRREIAKQLGILLQSSSDTFPSTVLESTLTGRHPYLHAWQWESSQDMEIAKQALESVDLGSMESRMTNTLSGGELRRLHLAALLAQEPQLYLLDEPTNHLDMHHQISILDLLCTLTQTKNKAAILIMHDLNLVHRYCDNSLLLLPGGETIVGPTSEILDSETLTRLLNHPTRKIETQQGPVFLPE